MSANMIVNNPKFEVSAVKPAQYPKNNLPEIVLVGKSNVGKSSFINAIANQKKLAKVGQTPGKTRSINYYNSVIRFIYDVVLDYPINQKQIPMLKGKRRLPKILSEEELNVFFNVCENYEYKTIFMLIYGSGLRISEATNLRIEDVDSKEMRLFVRNGKGERERYTVLPKCLLVSSLARCGICSKKGFAAGDKRALKSSIVHTSCSSAVFTSETVYLL